MSFILDRKIARPRRGQALVEFAVVALFLGVLLGAMVSFGHMFYVSHTIEQAVDVAAQEIARMPLPAVADLSEYLGNQAGSSDNRDLLTFRQQIYDKRHLVIHADELNGQSFVNHARTLPLLNRLLATAMIYDPSYAQGVYRYPGAIVSYTDDDGSPRETVLIPLLASDGRIGQWLAPIEEVASSSGVKPFSVAAADHENLNFVAGMVSLRINFPFQAAGLVNYVPADTSGNVTRVTADDDQAEGASLPAGYTLAVNSNDGPLDGTSRVNSGRFGLGRVAAYQDGAQSFGVRPWRRVIIAQAIYRREVFN